MTNVSDIGIHSQLPKVKGQSETNILILFDKKYRQFNKSYHDECFG